MKKLLPKYFSSEWSFAQFRVPDVRSIVAFGYLDENACIFVGIIAGYEWNSAHLEFKSVIFEISSEIL